MVARAKESIEKKIEEDLSLQTQTLWENEVQANIFVARVLLCSAFVAVVFMILNYMNLFSIEKNRVTSEMLEASLICLAASGVCFYFKGKKRWLKYFLLISYIAVFGRAEMVLGHNVYLLFCFPVIISTRYYSQSLTVGVSVLALLSALLADYFGITKGYGVADLNFVRMYPGSVLSIESSLRNAVNAAGAIDPEATWPHFLLESFVPRYILSTMAAIMCGKIALKGRQAIFAQQAETKKSERISTELNLASSIQANMLPNIFPAFPDRTDFDIYATMTPAKEVGGDFYDFFMIDENHLAIVIADVSGKGIPAAMFMVIAKTLIKDHTQLGLSPSEVFNRVNNLLCEGNEVGLFVTSWMGILDLQSGHLVYANAGHNPPLIMKNGVFSYMHCPPGFVLAGLEGYKYEEHEIDLSIGDRIFLYTDGVTEATNTKGELYGEDRLLECMSSLERSYQCATTLHVLRQDIDNFVGDAEQFDDLTMLILDFSPKEKNENLEMTFDAVDAKLPAVIDFVTRGLEEHDADMKSTMAITVALEEAFVNVAHYAYPDQPGKVIVGMNFNNNNTITIYMVDNGIPFNPLEHKDPDVNAKIEDRQVGGLGIYMIKKSMDHCRYERKGNQNRFIMIRRITS